MVRTHPDPPRLIGGLAQLGEHLLCKQGVVGSIPSSSTTMHEGREALGVKSWMSGRKRWYWTRYPSLLTEWQFFKNLEEVNI